VFSTRACCVEHFRVLCARTGSAQKQSASCSSSPRPASEEQGGKRASVHGRESQTPVTCSTSVRGRESRTSVSSLASLFLSPSPSPSLPETAAHCPNTHSVRACVWALCLSWCVLCAFCVCARCVCVIVCDAGSKSLNSM
jgi:hypothetical protein